MAVATVIKKQIGTIVLGNGINTDDRIKLAEEKGYEVRVFDTHVEIWADPKQIKK